MSGIDLKLMYEAFDELSEDYELSKSDIRFAFQEVLEEYFETPSILLQSKGLLIDGKYKNLRKYELDQLYQLLQTKLNLVRRESIKNYLKEVIIRNGGILYAKVLSYSDDETTISLQPYIGKKKPLEHLVLSYKIKKNKFGQYVKFPENLTYVPVFIEFPLVYRNKNRGEHHLFGSTVELMNKSLAKRHLQLLEEKLNQQYDVVLNLKVVDFKSSVVLEFSSDYVLTPEVLGYIVNYFKSFNIVAYVEQKS